MSYRSWLKDVKHMQDLGSHVYSTNQDWETQDKRDQKYYALAENPVKGLEGIAQYFYGTFHDAYLLGFERADREFSIKLGDLWLDEFLEQVATLAGVEVPDIDSHVTLSFHDVVYQTTLAARADGIVRFYRYEKPSSTDYLYRDWFYRQDNRLQWIASLDVYAEGRGKMSVGPFIVVDCSSVTVRDEREIRIRAAVSTQLAQMWSEFWADAPTFKRLWPPLANQAAFAKFLEERGWTISQLFPS